MEHLELVVALDHSGGALHEGVGGSAHDGDQVGGQLLKDEFADSAGALLVEHTLQCTPEY